MKFEELQTKVVWPECKVQIENKIIVEPKVHQDYDILLFVLVFRESAF